MADERIQRNDEERVNPASQIGRARQTGGTPESRRAVDDDVGTDGKRWRKPVEEDEPVEPPSGAAA